MPAEPSVHPFPGLRPFEENEQDLFFGREGQSEDILGRLRTQRFVAVVGASGSGKSSLIRAGLLPYLHGGFLAQAGSHWRIAIFRPGGDPIKNLAIALDDPEVLGRAADSADAAAQSAMLLEVTLRRSGLGLIEAVRLARLPEHQQVLVVVDQFEELFRFAGAADRLGREEDAAAFVKLLLEASTQRELPIYVVLTMRSDYIGDCARYRDLPETVTKGLYLIPRMTRDQRRAAIAEPVRVGGGTIAPRLVTRLLNDVGDDPDQLPILQHALMRTWDYWLAHGGGARPIDVEDYAAIGGMADALSQHADEAYDGLPDDRHRAIAKRMFQALSEKGPDNRETRRPTAAGKLAHVVDAPLDEVIRIVEDFRTPGRSFLTPAPSVALDPASVIDISHESLIRGWRRMRQWVEDEAESARQYRRLAETASLHAQGTAGLLRDPDLGNALIWRDKEHPNADWAHRYHAGFQQSMAFLEQSRVARDAERRQLQRARRRLQIAAGAAAAAITIVAVVASWEWHQATIESHREEQALAMTTELASSLVFDLVQDPRLRGVDPKMMAEITDRAARSADEVIAIAPTAAAYTARASTFHHKNQPDKAMADCDQAIQLDPNYFRAYNVRGILYSERKDFDRAIADFNQSIRLAPKFIFAYVNRGLAYADKGNLDRAMADYNEAITRSKGKYPQAYFARGNAYLDKKEYDRAIADYNRTSVIDPKWSIVYYERGKAYVAKSDYDHAIADFEQAITLDPKDPAAYNQLGYAYYNKKDYEHALAAYDRATAIDAKYALAYDNRGDVYRAKGDLDRAIADYSQAVAVDPKYLDGYNDRGNVYFEKSDYERAIADYNRAIALDPKLALLYKNRARAYQLKGDFDHALADFSQAIALDPKYVLAYDLRGDAYEAKGDFNDAIADFARAIALSPDDATLYDDRGVAYYLRGNYKQAIADYDRAIKIDEKYASAFLTRGLADLYAGLPANALADLQKSTALNPKDAYAAIWLEIVGKRANVPSQLPQAVKQIDMTAWPAPVIRLYLGQLTPQQVRAAANNAAATAKRGQTCEANFYSAELALATGGKDAALPLLRSAAADCPRDYYERQAADAELALLSESSANGAQQDPAPGR
jgi:tetratricopeptide (TPR) repeat protein